MTSFVKYNMVFPLNIFGKYLGVPNISRFNTCKIKNGFFKTRHEGFHHSEGWNWAMMSIGAGVGSGVALTGEAAVIHAGRRLQEFKKPVVPATCGSACLTFFWTRIDLKTFGSVAKESNETPRNALIKPIDRCPRIAADSHRLTPTKKMQYAKQKDRQSRTAGSPKLNVR